MKLLIPITLVFHLFFFCSTAVGKTKPEHKGHKPSSKKLEHHKDHKSHDHSEQKATLNQVAKNKLVIKVKGMVCAFCAQGIKENLNKQKEVKKTDVDLDNMQVIIELHEGKVLDEKRIEKIITDAGFSFVGVKKGTKN